MTACTEPEVGEGEIDIRAWGEDFIEIGIPADQMADGWAIEFERFEVELREISVAGVELDTVVTVDVSSVSNPDDAVEGRVGQIVGTVRAPAGDHDHAAFTISQISIEGSAHGDNQHKTFAWTFDTPTRYDQCETTTAVTDGGLANFVITIHADHLFGDSLVADELVLRFAAIAAADTDADGEITMAELAAVDIGAYDPGNLPVDDLWSFLAAQAQTMGHVDGEGHCHASPV